MILIMLIMLGIFKNSFSLSLQYRHSLPTVITTHHPTLLPGLHPGSEILPEIVEEGPKQDSPGLAPPSIEKGGWVGMVAKSPSLLRLKSMSVDESKLGGKQGGGGKKVDTLGGGAGLAPVGIPVLKSKSKDEFPIEKSTSSVPKRAKTREEVMQDLKKVLKDEDQPASSQEIAESTALLQEMK